VTSGSALARDTAACRLTGTLPFRSGQAASAYPGAVRHLGAAGYWYP
jgi:hypothetical protein